MEARPSIKTAQNFQRDLGHSHPITQTQGCNKVLKNFAIKLQLGYPVLILNRYRTTLESKLDLWQFIVWKPLRLLCFLSMMDRPLPLDINKYFEIYIDFREVGSAPMKKDTAHGFVVTTANTEKLNLVAPP
jgi:hypothetical protein